MWLRKFNQVFIFTVLSFFLFSSCTEDTPELLTVQRTIDQVKNDWRYYGFSYYFDEYQPNQEILDSIKDRFDPSVHKFLLFTSPSCYSCGQMDTLLPYTAKIIKTAQFSDDDYHLFDTPNIAASHPFDTLIILKSLPSVFTLNEEKIYSVLDTFYLKQQDDPNITLEEIILESLR
jgi:hypothetical protein